VFEESEWLVQAAQSSETDAIQANWMGSLFQPVLWWPAARTGKFVGIIGLVGYGSFERAVLNFAVDYCNLTFVKNLPYRVLIGGA